MMSDNIKNSNEEKKDTYVNVSLEDLERLIEHEVFDNDIDFESERNFDALNEMLTAYRKRDGVLDVDTNEILEEFYSDYIGEREKFPLIETNNKMNNTVRYNREDIKKPKFRNLKRFGVVAAIFIIMLTVLFTTAAALNFPFMQIFAQWTRETFRFTTEYQPFEIDERLLSLHEALEEYGITDLVAPTWLPDGFELEDLSVHDTPAMITFIAFYEYEDKTLIIQINKVNENATIIFQKDEGDAENFHRNGIDHYFMTNADRLLVLWATGDYENSIFGDIAVNQAKVMISSIYER